MQYTLTNVCQMIAIFFTTQWCRKIRFPRVRTALKLRSLDSVSRYSENAQPDRCNMVVQHFMVILIR